MSANLARATVDILREKLSQHHHLASQVRGCSSRSLSKTICGASVATVCFPSDRFRRVSVVGDTYGLAGRAQTVVAAGSTPDLRMTSINVAA